VTTTTVDEAAEQTDSKQLPEKEHRPGPPPNATPRERLLWTPTPGEDATKILFPLSRSYAQARISCSCGTELLVHWQARTGLIIGDHLVRCPNCGTSHDTPDKPLRLFRRDGDDWTPAPLE
jgi:hypothetical protein